LCKLILHGKLLGFYKRAQSGQSSSSVLRRRRNTLPALPTSPVRPHSPAAKPPQPGGVRTVPMPPAHLPSAPSSCLWPAKGRRAPRSARRAPGPCRLPAEITPRRITPGAGANGATPRRVGRGAGGRVAPLCPVLAAAGDGAYLGSALPGRGWLLPSLRPAHRPPGRLLSAGVAAPRRGSAPGRPAGAGWHPSPSAPSLSRKALLGRSAEAHVPGTVSTPSHPLGVRSCQFHLWAVLTTLGLSTAPLLVAPDVTADTLL